MQPSGVVATSAVNTSRCTGYGARAAHTRMRSNFIVILDQTAARADRCLHAAAPISASNAEPHARTAGVLRALAGSWRRSWRRVIRSRTWTCQGWRHQHGFEWSLKCCPRRWHHAERLHGGQTGCPIVATMPRAHPRSAHLVRQGLCFQSGALGAMTLALHHPARAQLHDGMQRFDDDAERRTAQDDDAAERHEAPQGTRKAPKHGPQSRHGRKLTRRPPPCHRTLTPPRDTTVTSAEERLASGCQQDHVKLRGDGSRVAPRVGGTGRPRSFVVVARIDLPRTAIVLSRVCSCEMPPAGAPCLVTDTDERLQLPRCTARPRRVASPAPAQSTLA